MKSRGPAHSAIRGTNVKSQMLSFQIFTGLRAIRLFQINGAIGNERGSEGHGNHGLLGTTNPDFLVPWSSSPHRVVSRRFIVARYVYMYACAYVASICIIIDTTLSYMKLTRAGILRHVSLMLFDKGVSLR